MIINTSRKLIAGLAFAGAALCSTQAYAGGASLTLSRVSLDNVDDATGRWQHEAGNVLKGTTTVGTYVIIRRVTYAGTSVYNAAAETVHLLLPAAGEAMPPQNITLQGVHSFNSGTFIGGVSATSTHYTFAQGGQATIVIPASGVQTLTLTWNGSNQLTLP